LREGGVRTRHVRDDGVLSISVDLLGTDDDDTVLAGRVARVPEERCTLKER
jgi:hypothetical protein